MGEVYRARDTRLNRTVAIKVLQAAVASDPERVARFEREAQILASLNHPNIAGIYGLESANNNAYLVLEFVDGRPLDAVLRGGGALPPAHAQAIARQIADAIAAAHERGIIHRDLKPANVMVTADDQVKVLDFGLGKSLDDGHPASGESAAANSPTITLGSTQAGIVLGTAGYMSPEQAKGRAADRRSDVWSFGCVLFEMLAGSRAFEGEDVTDTIAAIVRGEPNWKALPPSTPAALRQLIERTLIKDRAQRLPDMSVVRYILNEPGLLDVSRTNLPAGEAPQAAITQPVAAVAAPARFWMITALIAIVTTIALGIAYFSPGGGRSADSSAANPSHYSIVLPDGVEVVNTNMAPLAISPDGRLIAFPGRKAGRIQLYLHDVSTGETKALEGTDDARSPFFKPDGRWIGFLGKGKVRKITIGGTSYFELADAPDARGGAWGPDDTIYFAPTNTSGLWKVSAAGGTAIELTRPDPNASEISHRYPYVLSDGKSLLFAVWTGPGSNEHRIERLSLADQKREIVVRNAESPAFVVNGQIVYGGASDAMLSAPWTPSHPGLDGVESKALPFFAQMDNEGAAAFAVAASNTVARLMGAPGRRLARIVWVDKTGNIEPLPLPERDYVSAAISPDGTRVAVHHRGGTEEIWIYDLRTKTFTPLMTRGGSSQAPVWTVDSKYLVYRGTRQGHRNLFRKAADGNGEEDALTSATGVIETPTSATPDGKWIVFVSSGVQTRAGLATGSGDIYKVALDGRHDVAPVVQTPAFENGGTVSPDGRQVAYETNVTNRMEIWVRPLDSAAAASGRQVSREGGTGARWSRDGRELYFLTPTGIMTATISGDAIPLPRLFVEGRFRLPANANTNYDAAKDGRLLAVLPIEPIRPQTRIEVTLNAIR